MVKETLSIVSKFNFHTLIFIQSIWNQALTQEKGNRLEGSII